MGDRHSVPPFSVCWSRGRTRTTCQTRVRFFSFSFPYSGYLAAVILVRSEFYHLTISFSSSSSWSGYGLSISSSTLLCAELTPRYVSFSFTHPFFLVMFSLCCNQFPFSFYLSLKSLSKSFQVVSSASLLHSPHLLWNLWDFGIRWATFSLHNCRSTHNIWLERKVLCPSKRTDNP